MEGNDDLRSALTAAFAEAKAEPVEKVEKPAIDVTSTTLETKTAPLAPPADRGDGRDATGRFVAKTEGQKIIPPIPEPEDPGKTYQGYESPKPSIEPKPTSIDAQAAQNVVGAPAPPNGWSAEAKAKWHELPPEIQAAVAKREQDAAKFASKFDEERAFGREVQRVVQPYLAQIQAEGGTPAGAIQSLLNTAYVLRNGSPTQKQQALMSVAQQFGIDIAGVSQQPHSNQSPEVQALMQRLAHLESQLTHSSESARLAAQQEVMQDIDAFKADPANAHFEEVKGHMAALLSSGAAKDLKEAYDAACWARPDIRATLQAQERAAAEAKRRADETRRLEDARRKAVSVVGAPGIAVPNIAPDANRSLRDEIAANFAAARANGAV